MGTKNKAKKIVMKPCYRSKVEKDKKKEEKKNPKLKREDIEQQDGSS